MWRVGAELVLLVCVCVCLPMGCTGRAYRGGWSIEEDQNITGELLSVWVPRDCHDVRGQPLPDRRSIISLVNNRGRVLLVERRPEYRTVVVSNANAVGEARLFQLVAHTAEGDFLHEYFTPQSPMTDGLVRVSHEFGMMRSRYGWRMVSLATSFECRLARDGLIGSLPRNQRSGSRVGW
jgi:hypothetical protein